MNIHHDEGAGITAESLKLLDDFLAVHGSFKASEMHIDSDRPVFKAEIRGTHYNWLDRELVEEDVILLSGLNCGYGGEGPRGTVEAIRKFGYIVGDMQKITIMGGAQRVQVRFCGHEGLFVKAVA